MLRMFSLWWTVLLALAGCLDATGGDEVGTSAAALTPVTWTDVVGASALGNDLTKTAPETAWNAGAVSVESLNGDGYVEFTTGEATTDKMAGLSVGNGGQSYQDIDFAIRLGATGLASVWEGGTRRVGIGGYAVGDVFRVQAEGVVVTYYKNGVLKYTSALAPSFPLLVDTSLRTPGATIDDAVLESLVFWTDTVGVSAVGNDLTKTAPETLWNAGAVSVESLTGDGYVEFSTREATTDKAIGLASGDATHKLGNLDFGFRLNGTGKITIWEGGTRIATLNGLYRAGDVFRVQVQGGFVHYFTNGSVRAGHAVAPSFPLRVDTALRTPGATLQDVVLQSTAFWTETVNVAVDGEDLSKTAPEDSFNAGAVSVASIPDGDGYVEFRVADATTQKAAGLSNGNGNATRNDIDFAISLSATGGVSVYERGTRIGSFGRYHVDDTFQVGVSGGVVTYYKNWVPLYTSLATPTFPLLLDTSLATPGARIIDARVLGGAPVADCSPLAQELPSPGDFARHLSAAGNVLVVGHPEDAPSHANIYRRFSGGWAEEQNLINPNDFGQTVATDGQTVVVGGQTGTWIYRWAGGQWVEDHVGSTDYYSVAVQGDLLAGGRLYTGSCCDRDHVVVNRRGTGGWTQEALLIPPDSVVGDGFGSALAFGGDRLFIGARFNDTAAADAGAIYVYRYDPAAPPNNKWQLETTLYASNAQPGDWFPSFGIDASDDGTRFIAGNQKRDTAHIFEVGSGGWSETAILTGQPYRLRFGRDVAFGGPDPTGTIAVVGAEQGAAFVFAEAGGEWTQIDVLSAPASATTHYAEDVDVTADTVFIADTYADVGATEVFIHDFDPVCLPE